MKKFLAALYRFEAVLSKILEVFITACIITVFVGIFVTTITRYLFGFSIMGVAEILLILFILANSIGSSLLIRDGENIAITYFIDLMPQKVRRFFHILSLVAVIVMNYYFTSLSMGWLNATRTYRSMVTNIPHWISEIGIPIGCSLVILFASIAIIKLLFDPEAYYSKLAEDVSTT